MKLEHLSDRCLDGQIKAAEGKGSEDYLQKLKEEKLRRENKGK
jgi:hypothetical protein